MGWASRAPGRWVHGLGRRRSISRCSSRRLACRAALAPGRWAPAARRRLAATNGLRRFGFWIVSFIGFSFGGSDSEPQKTRTARVAGATRAVGHGPARQAPGLWLPRAPGGAPSTRAPAPAVAPASALLQARRQATAPTRSPNTARWAAWAVDSGLRWQNRFMAWGFGWIGWAGRRAARLVEGLSAAGHRPLQACADDKDGVISAQDGLPRGNPEMWRTSSFKLGMRGFRARAPERPSARAPERPACPPATALRALCSHFALRTSHFARRTSHVALGTWHVALRASWFALLARAPAPAPPISCA